jgi:hypothetical protein
VAGLVRRFPLTVVIFLAACSGPKAVPSATARPSGSETTESTSTFSGPSTTRLPPARTPLETVTAYYAALGQHDTVSAASLLAPEIRDFQESTFGSDFTNVVSLTDIHDAVEAHVPPPGGIPSGYQDITQVSLAYNVVYKQVITDGSGPATRFVYVGRTSAAAPWLIIAIGTGP